MPLFSGCGLPPGKWAERAVGIAGGWLDLDDVRAEVRHQLRGIGGGAGAVAFDDGQAFEGAVGHGSHIDMAAECT